MNSLVQWKVVFIFVNLIVTALVTAAPLFIARFCGSRLQRNNRKRTAIFNCVVNCFSAGVFLGTAFLHLLPETLAHFDELVKTGSVKEFDPVQKNETLSGTAKLQLPANGEEKEEEHTFPWSCVLILGGFFLTYFVEIITDHIVETCQKKRHRQLHETRQLECAEDSVANEFSNLNTPSDSIVSSERKHSNVADGVTVVAALSVHSILEGITVGIGATHKSLAIRAIAIAIHKIFVSLVIGMLLVKCCGKRVAIFACLAAIFACGSPLGVGIGTATTSYGATGSGAYYYAIVVLEAVSTGMFIFIAFIELLMKECAKDEFHAFKGVITLAGVCVVVALMYIMQQVLESH